MLTINKHRLTYQDGTPLPFEPTPNKRGRLKDQKPRFIIVHYTASGSLKGTVRWFQNPKSNASAHLVIGRNGDIVQMGHFNQRLWHAGRSRWGDYKNLNSHSVGIELVNWGGLKGTAGNYRSWTGKRVRDTQVVVLAHRNNPLVQRPWQTYPDAQVLACALAVKSLALAYGLSCESVLGHEDIAPRRKTDPGPAFDMELFCSSIFEEPAFRLSEQMDGLAEHQQIGEIGKKFS